SPTLYIHQYSTHPSLPSFPTRRSSDLQPPAPNGYAVQLTVTDSATSTPVTRFGKPVIVHLLMTTGGLTPSFSSDGTTWTPLPLLDRKSTRLNSSHEWISYAVFCLKKKI